MSRSLLMWLFAVIAASANADSATSLSFALDLHYDSIVDESQLDMGVEVYGESTCLAVRTVDRAPDVNADGIPDWWETYYGVQKGSFAPFDDADGDGFCNLAEFNADTNPLMADRINSLGACSSCCLVDTGGRATCLDQNYDLTEIWSCASPFIVDTVGRSPDSDGDGIPDWYEYLWGMNPEKEDASEDSDGDGFSNRQEYNAGTNPMFAENWILSSMESSHHFETDTMGLSRDGRPLEGETMAVVMTSIGFVCDTGGLYYDWDGDGIPNWWELRYSLDGSKISVNPGVDDDGDGVSNLAEFVAYTDPTNAMSRFTVGLARLVLLDDKIATGNLIGNERFVLKWDSAVGRTYIVLASDGSEGFCQVKKIRGTGAPIEYVPPQDKTMMLYKVAVELDEWQ